MKKDILALFDDKKPFKIPSKETLNHAGLIHLASGIDPMKDTKKAYLEAYKSLGIDFINRVPEKNAKKPLDIGESIDEGNGYLRLNLGLYDTYYRKKYPFNNIEEFLSSDSIELNYDDLITPVPHRLDIEEINRKNNLVGEYGLYYYMLYTTLFMWGVEYLGWEVFMLAAAIDSILFDKLFLTRAFKESMRNIKKLIEVDSPFVFLHDDLAAANGSVFSPDWYCEYIFPRYKIMFKKIHDNNKKIIFTADGNMATVLEYLLDAGVDGVMLENPATDFDIICDIFSDKIIIGGIDTKILTFGNEDEIKGHTYDVYKKTKNISGYVMSTPGGIHGNIPLSNLTAYFDARAEIGITPVNWKKAIGDKK